MARVTVAAATVVAQAIAVEFRQARGRQWRRPWPCVPRSWLGRPRRRPQLAAVVAPGSVVVVSIDEILVRTIAAETATIVRPRQSKQRLSGRTQQTRQPGSWLGWPRQDCNGNGTALPSNTVLKRDKLKKQLRRIQNLSGNFSLLCVRTWHVK